jgi:hypothetical protein
MKLCHPDAKLRECGQVESQCVAAKLENDGDHHRKEPSGQQRVVLAENVIGKRQVCLSDVAIYGLRVLEKGMQVLPPDTQFLDALSLGQFFECHATPSSTTEPKP